MTARRATPTIDWDDVRRRLARVAEAVDDPRRLSAERTRALLEERARRLAAIPARPPDRVEALEVLIFRLGRETFALETRFVRRVERHELPTPVPGSPESLAGVVTAQGEILAVFDLRVLLRLDRPTATDQARILVVGDRRDEFGILADSALEVVGLPLAAIHPPQAPFAGCADCCVQGVTDDAVCVLDGASLLDDGRLVVDQTEGANPVARRDSHA